MKKLLQCGFLVLCTNILAQTGINQTNPKATLDIQAKNTDGSTKEGLLIPRLSKSALANMGTDVEESTTVYVNEIDGVPIETQTTTVANVFEKGFYSFMNGTWKKHKVKNSEPDFNKIYVCSDVNVGQILLTNHGYFKCKNTYKQYNSQGEFESEELLEYNIGWFYYGLMEGSGMVLDVDSNDTYRYMEVHYTASIDQDKIISEYYDAGVVYNLNGDIFSQIEPGTTDWTPFIALGTKLKAQGIYSFYYDPHYLCGKELETAVAFTLNKIIDLPKEYFVSEFFYKFDRDNPTCPNNLTLIHTGSRLLKYTIIED